tara:strand:- start:57 stop:650 length:594 start_codon:yes stop_codon:yes gene_type:complete
MVSTLKLTKIQHPNDTDAVQVGSDGSISFSVDKRENIVTGTAESMSGTENTITGIPSNAHCVRLYIDGTYKTGSNTQSRFRIGAGSIATSGYDWRVNAPSAGGTAYTEGSTAGCDTYMDGAQGSSYTVWGYYEVRKMISTSNRYLITSWLMSNNSYYLNQGIGYIDLGGTLDRVQWTTVNGTATFAGGKIYLEYTTI